MLSRIFKENNLSISPRKANVMASFIREKFIKEKKDIEKILLILSNSSLKSGRIFYKIITSALNQIKASFKMKNEDFINYRNTFYFDFILVGRGVIRKKPTQRAKGRTDVLRKSYSNVTICIKSFSEYLSFVSENSLSNLQDKEKI
jgi:ribosomal protein L22